MTRTAAARLVTKLEDKQREYEDLLVEVISTGTSHVRYPDGVLPVEVALRLSKLRREVDIAKNALQSA